MERKPLTDREIIDAERKPLWQRLLWMIGIWTLSVAALAIVAGVLRILMSAAGLTIH